VSLAHPAPRVAVVAFPRLIDSDNNTAQAVEALLQEAI
jgi:hypothetical protein